MNLLAVMYHYIESEEKYSAGIFPTAPERLSGQIQAIQKKYTFLSQQELVLALEGKKSIPEKAAVLTFDDGLLSHYLTAKPILEQFEVPAIFYVPTQHLIEKKAYLIHKVHFLLAHVPIEDLLPLFEKAYAELTGKVVDWSVLDMQTVTGWYRYDTPDVARLKYLMNHFLEPEIAATLIENLFLQVYTQGESAFCESLYMSLEHLKELKEHPLISVGLHTHTHLDIPASDESLVVNDISKNFEILSPLFGETLRSIAYPFGLVTQDTFEHKIQKAVTSLPLQFGFNTEKKLNTDFHSPFLLGRFGANDITGGKRPIFEI